MILVDTSVWIDHFEREDARLVGLLRDGQVLTHVFVEGELASGSLQKRSEILRFLGKLPRMPMIAHAEVRSLLESMHLHGRGVGWIDLHLIASALATSHRLWTYDRRLERVASQLGIAA